jgi:predicted chitinase
VKNANLKRGDHFTKERLMYNSTPLSICWTIPLKRSATLQKIIGKVKQINKNITACRMENEKST